MAINFTACETNDDNDDDDESGDDDSADDDSADDDDDDDDNDDDDSGPNWDNTCGVEIQQDRDSCEDMGENFKWDDGLSSESACETWCESWGDATSFHHYYGDDWELCIGLCTCCWYNF